MTLGRQSPLLPAGFGPYGVFRLPRLIRFEASEKGANANPVEEVDDRDVTPDLPMAQRLEGVVQFVTD
jgi:hypothetical protein